MGKKYRVGVIKGDGIGPEIIEASLYIVPHLGVDMEIIELQAGYEYYRRTGKVVEEEFFDKIKKLDAVLKGPLYTPPHDPNFRSVNILIRKELGLYANIRPFKSFKSISQKQFNLVIFRENTEGEYVGIEGMFNDVAVSLRITSRRGSERIVRLAFNYAKAVGFNKVTVVHKANILKISDGLFRDMFFKISKEFPGIVADEVIVDTAAYQLVKNPEKFQVLVTPNLYGDILSDLVGGLMGSLGLCGSALVGDGVGVFEPIHGVALDIVGKGIANPVGVLMALKLMLEYFGQKYEDKQAMGASKVLEEAIYRVIDEKHIWTPDLGGEYKTIDITKAVAGEVKVIQEERS